jgi:hypothetical protein
VLLKTELHWSYTPTDLIEPDTPTIKTALGEWKFDAGRATCTLGTPMEPVTGPTLQEVREELEHMLAIRGMQVDRVYDAAPHPTIHQHTENGISHTMTGGAGLFALSSTVQAETVVRDAAGNILSDSGKQRREHDSRGITELSAAMARSEPLAFMCASYLKAMRQPESEFVRLFEIVDALVKRYRDEPSAKTALKAAASARNELGQLANDAPVLEGRHNGYHIDQLRPATPEEKARARRAAKALIQAFADTL